MLTFRLCRALLIVCSYMFETFVTFVCSGLLCKVSAGNDVACLTTNHLAALAKLEPRLVPLVLAFRYWARVRLCRHTSADQKRHIDVPTLDSMKLFNKCALRVPQFRLIRKYIFFCLPCFFIAVSHRLPGRRRHPLILLCPHGHLLPAAEKGAHPPCLPGTLGK